MQEFLWQISKKQTAATKQPWKRRILFIHRLGRNITHLFTPAWWYHFWSNRGKDILQVSCCSLPLLYHKRQLDSVHPAVLTPAGSSPPAASHQAGTRQAALERDAVPCIKSPRELRERSTSPAPGNRVRQTWVFKIQPRGWVKDTSLTFWTWSCYFWTVWKCNHRWSSALAGAERQVWKKTLIARRLVSSFFWSVWSFSFVVSQVWAKNGLQSLNHFLLTALQLFYWPKAKNFTMQTLVQTFELLMGLAGSQGFAG